MKPFIRILSILILMAVSSAFGAAEPECVEWFIRSKLKKDDPNCFTVCQTTSVNLGTYFCTDRCDELCRPQVNCDQYRSAVEKSFSDQAPDKWLEPSEKSKPWNSSERKLVAAAILKLPRSLVEKSTFKIHRMSVGKLKTNQASTMNKAIVLYDAAFSSSIPLERVLGHELAHVYWNGLAVTDRKKYEIAANWIRDINGYPIFGRDPKTATEIDGTLMPTEDFANNVEYLLFDPQKLKKLTPSLFGWFRTTLGAKFELGGECAQSSL